MGNWIKLDINYGIISEKKLKNGRTEKIGKTILETPRQANNWNKKNAEKWQKRENQNNGEKK